MTKLLLLSGILALGACTTAESTGLEPVSCPPDSTLTYQSFGSAFFSNNCAHCHDSKEKPTLATQSQIQSNATMILQEAVYTTAMPEDSAMTISERAQLGEWLACGAP